MTARPTRARKAEFAEKLLIAAEVALPSVRAAVRLVMPGTPVTFQRFTHRQRGWVGGFPQTSLLRSLAPASRSQPVAGG